jgi:hypothetical protein
MLIANFIARLKRIYVSAIDNKHISQRTGKKIPLDVETNDPSTPQQQTHQVQQSPRF